MDQGFIYDYNPLWKLLIDRRMKKKDLQALTRLSANVITKMGRGESVTLAKICRALRCQLSDIVELDFR